MELENRRLVLSDIRTDLALEANAFLRGDAHTEVPGVRMQEDRRENFTISRVEIISPEGERNLGKAMGHYITIEAPGLRRRNRELQEEVGIALAEEVQRMLGLGPNSTVLVVGLGNWNATPDALGPKVVSSLLVTRHLHGRVPAELTNGLGSVAAIAPGVLGLTGIETGEIIRAIVDRIRPDVVVCIDALAARSVERIGTTVQIADTGINPGSGVGNRRAAINRETMGMPVIAIGVPTVVHAHTIAHDVIDLLGDKLRGRSVFFDMFTQMSTEEKRNTIREVLVPSVGDLVVTPKEVDSMITDMARVIAGALNVAVHPRIEPKDLQQYLN